MDMYGTAYPVRLTGFRQRKIRVRDRRDFLKLGGQAVAAAAFGPVDLTAIDTVRIGYVGIGGQGSSHVRNLLKIPGCRITAVCDIRPERTDWATKQITAAGHPAPTAYTRGPQDFLRLCET